MCLNAKEYRYWHYILGNLIPRLEEEAYKTTF